jgi:hypothetical protein
VTIEDLVAKLIDCLTPLDPGNKSSIRQFAHQLVKGSKDEKAVADKMTELGRAKSSLILRIQVANVGLTRGVEEAIVANADVINRIHTLLQQTFGAGRGLKLAEFFDNRLTQGMLNRLLTSGN